MGRSVKALGCYKTAGEIQRVLKPTSTMLSVTPTLEEKNLAKYELMVLILPTKHSKSVHSFLQYSHNEALNEIIS